MSAQHTPGPWRVNGGGVSGGDHRWATIEGRDPRSGSFLRNADGELTLTPRGVMVASVSDNNAQQAANVRLIASAPALLEALEEAIVVMTAETIGTYSMDDPDWYAALGKAVAKARAAIASATGADQ